MLWIRIGFNADPDPTFYLSPDPDPGSQTNADLYPDPGQTLKVHKNENFFGFDFEFCIFSLLVMHK